MQTFKEAIKEGGWEQGEGMYLRKVIGDIEICLEPLLFDNQMYLAVYKNQSLLFPKLPIKLGTTKTNS